MKHKWIVVTCILLLLLVTFVFGVTCGWELMKEYLRQGNIEQICKWVLM